MEVVDDAIYAVVDGACRVRARRIGTTDVCCQQQLSGAVRERESRRRDVHVGARCAATRVSVDDECGRHAIRRIRRVIVVSTGRVTASMVGGMYDLLKKPNLLFFCF